MFGSVRAWSKIRSNNFAVASVVGFMGGEGAPVERLRPLLSGIV
jgi:hypothetical protein